MSEKEFIEIEDKNQIPYEEFLNIDSKIIFDFKNELKLNFLLSSVCQNNDVNF